jgi:hypothetical protein
MIISGERIEVFVTSQSSRGVVTLTEYAGLIPCLWDETKTVLRGTPFAGIESIKATVQIDNRVALPTTGFCFRRKGRYYRVKEQQALDPLSLVDERMVMVEELATVENPSSL